ncbi:MAG: TetR/AcrR family transcriptional regulator [Acholeplasmataceae bacterium]
MSKKNEFSTKEAIINATKEVLKQNGNVTIKDIAEAAFVNIAAINYHFGSKDNLINIVITELIKELRTKVVKIINEKAVKGNFQELIDSIVDEVFTFAQDNQGIVSYSFVQIVNEPSSSNVFVESFLSDEQFVSLIIESLRLNFPEASYETLFAKYLVIFSSFVVPFFLNFTIINERSPYKTDAMNAFEQFKDAYIAELKAILVP